MNDHRRKTFRTDQLAAYDAIMKWIDGGGDELLSASAATPAAGKSTLVSLVANRDRAPGVLCVHWQGDVERASSEAPGCRH